VVLIKTVKHPVRDQTRLTSIFFPVGFFAETQGRAGNGSQYRGPQKHLMCTSHGHSSNSVKCCAEKVDPPGPATASAREA
jgi:hypothetical protein